MASMINLTVAFSGDILEDAVTGRGVEVLVAEPGELAKAEALVKDTVAQEWIGLDGVGDKGAEVLKILAEYRAKY